MKFLFLTLMTFVTANAFAGNTACTDYNTQTRIAREAVRSLMALANAPNVEAYYGGVESDQNGIMTVNVQPHFKLNKDWYKVVIRNSDCRVMNVSLFLENLPIN
ncbi:MAG: hypothetical protein ACXVAJ_08170 [Parachlamydiaceae bacterium]